MTPRRRTVTDLASVSVRAPAKINLFLRVLAREVSGYHQIETLFTAVDLCDEISVDRAECGVSIEVTGADVGPDESNLAYVAAQSFLDATSASTGVHVTLTKHIPTGAGLGGGSSDAGATLRALNVLHGKPLQASELLGLAIDIGADVPFFASGLGRALAWGRGDRLLGLSGAADFPVLLALPSLQVSTRDAYSQLPVPTDRMPGMMEPAAFERWGGVAAIAVNEFEPTVFSAHPELGALRGAMESGGALTARLSGSGAALFALFEVVDDARAARDSLSSKWPDVRFVVTGTLADQPVPTFTL